MQIVMHPDEVSLLKGFLSETNNYFEYGIGGSTHLASKLVKGDIFGIESDALWVEKVKKETACNKRIHLRHIDIGPTGDWGFPRSSERKAFYGEYSKAIVETGRNDFDFCLVDGRFRVASFLQALMHLESSAVIAMHDYTDRKEYHLVEKYAQPISSVRRLKFFVRRTDCDFDGLIRDLRTYSNNPA